MTTTSEILSKSLNLLRANGWCKGLLETQGPRPRYCAVGAVLAVEDMPYTAAVNSSPLRALEAIIAEQYPDRSAKSDQDETYTSSAWGKIVYFNNHDDTDFADIERVFEKAVLAAAERDD
jgi:hypothetical protein